MRCVDTCGAVVVREKRRMSSQFFFFFFFFFIIIFFFIIFFFFFFQAEVSTLKKSMNTLLSKMEAERSEKVLLQAQTDSYKLRFDQMEREKQQLRDVVAKTDADRLRVVEGLEQTIRTLKEEATAATAAAATAQANADAAELRASQSTAFSEAELDGPVTGTMVLTRTPSGKLTREGMGKPKLTPRGEAARLITPDGGRVGEPDLRRAGCCGRDPNTRRCQGCAVM